MKEISTQPLGETKKQCPFHKSSSISSEENEQETMVNSEKLLKSCPNTDLTQPPKLISKNEKNDFCKFHKHVAPDPKTFTITKELDIDRCFESKSTGPLLIDIGGGDRIREFCTRFYARMFEDAHLKQFIFETDGAEAHGKRLGDWIIEKMGCKLEGEPWSESGRYGERQRSHYKAWNNEIRDKSVRGKHFKLDDSRIWVRLHFWAVRECGLSEHVPFWSWYKEFIEHFIGIYEYKAIAYVQKDAEWSSKKKNLQKYFHDKNMMKDVVGKK
eukprot:gene8899-847_t